MTAITTKLSLCDQYELFLTKEVSAQELYIRQVEESSRTAERKAFLLKNANKILEHKRRALRIWKNT